MGIRSVGVGVATSQNIPLSVLVHNPHKGLAREISHESGRKRWKEGPRAEQRRRQNREVDRTGQSAGENRRLLGPMDSEVELANARRWVSVPGGFVGISLEYTPAIACRYTESYAKVSETSPFLRLQLTQVRVCFFLFSFILLVVYVVFCVSVRKWEILLAGDERNHLTIWWPWVV